MSERQSQRRRVGQVKEVTSLSNPLIKDIRALSQKKYRDQTHSFLAEGLKLVLDAFEMGWTIRTLIYSKAGKGNKAVEQAAARTVAAGGLVLEVSEKVLGAITRRDNPQMVAAVFEQKLTPLDQIRPAGQDIWIALDRVRDPGNLGTIIRTADAVGASGLILIGDTTDPFSLETVRATMGSIFALPIAKTREGEFLDWLGSLDAMTVATHLDGTIDYRKPDYAGRSVILLMGNEQQGLSPVLAEASSKLVRIPQAGRADSLNLAVATGIMLYEICRNRLPDAGKEGF